MEDTPLVSFVTEVKKWKDIEPSRSLNDKMRVGDSKVDNSQDHLNTRTHSHSGWHCGLVSGKKKQKNDCITTLDNVQILCVFEVSASCCLPAENQLDWKKAAGRKRKEKDAQKRKPISVTIKPWNHQTAATYQEINQWCVAKWKKKQHFNHVKLEKLAKEK